MGKINPLTIICAIVLVLTLYVMWWAYYSVNNVTKVYSNIDHEPYMIHRAHRHKQAAADRMAAINKINIDLLRHLKNKYIRSDTPAGLSKADRNKFLDDREKVLYLLGNYNPDVLIENSPKNFEIVNPWKKTTAYTENKGHTFVICLRKNTPNAEFEKLNLVIFVVIHEVAHLMTDQYGHDLPFWRNFQFLLKEAVEIGIYKPIDYKKYPAVYCDLKLDYNPLFDSTL